MTRFFPGEPYPTLNYGLILNGQESLDMLNTAIEEAPSINVATDFDGTLTVKDPNGFHGTTWEALVELMTDVQQQRHAELYNEFHPIEESKKLDNPYINPLTRMSTHLSNDEVWQIGGLTCTYGIKEEDAVRATLQRVRMKHGIARVFRRFLEEDIDVDVKSTSIRSLIEARFKASHVAFPNIAIYANDLELDGNGRFKMFDEESMVRSTNKHLFGRRPTLEQNTGHLSVVLGDNLHDKDLSDSPPDRTFAVRADGGLSQMQALGGIERVRRYVGESFDAGFQAVAVDSNLFCIDALTRELTSHRDHHAA